MDGNHRKRHDGGKIVYIRDTDAVWRQLMSRPDSDSTEPKNSNPNRGIQLDSKSSSSLIPHSNSSPRTMSSRTNPNIPAFEIHHAADETSSRAGTTQRAENSGQYLTVQNPNVDWDVATLVGSDSDSSNNSGHDGDDEADERTSVPPTRPRTRPPTPHGLTFLSIHDAMSSSDGLVVIAARRAQQAGRSGIYVRQARMPFTPGSPTHSTFSSSSYSSSSGFSHHSAASSTVGQNGVNLAGHRQDGSVLSDTNNSSASRPEGSDLSSDWTGAGNGRDSDTTVH